MKPKIKVISAYIVEWIMVLFFIFMALWMYNLIIDNDNSFDNSLPAKVSFIIGTVFGLSVAGFSYSLVEAFTPIIKYIKAKIHKENKSFVYILTSK